MRVAFVLRSTEVQLLVGDLCGPYMQKRAIVDVQTACLSPPPLFESTSGLAYPAGSSNLSPFCANGTTLNLYELLVVVACRHCVLGHGGGSDDGRQHGQVELQFGLYGDTTASLDGFAVLVYCVYNPPGIG